MNITEHWPLGREKFPLDHRENKNLHRWTQMLKIEEDLLIQLCEHSEFATANEKKEKIKFNFPVETSLLHSIIVRRGRISFVLHYPILFAGNPEDFSKIQQYLRGIETVRKQFHELLDFSWKSKFVANNNWQRTLDAFTKSLVTKDTFHRTTAAMRGVLMDAFQPFLEGNQFHRQTREEQDIAEEL